MAMRMVSKTMNPGSNPGSPARPLPAREDVHATLARLRVVSRP